MSAGQKRERLFAGLALVVCLAPLLGLPLSGCTNGPIWVLPSSPSITWL